MRSAISWMTVLAMVLAACGTPSVEDAASPAANTETEQAIVEDTAPSTAADDAAAPDPDAPDPDAPDPVETEDSQAEPPSTDAGDEARTEGVDERSTKEPERVEEEEPASAGVGPVPAELMAAIMDDMSSRTGGSAQEFEVVRAEAVTWADGSLGCAKPGETYTMALVDGYWIEVAHGGDVHDYRANDKGFFKYCEGGIPPINPNA